MFKVGDIIRRKKDFGFHYQWKKEGYVVWQVSEGRVWIHNSPGVDSSPWDADNFELVRSAAPRGKKTNGYVKFMEAHGI